MTIVATVAIFIYLVMIWAIITYEGLRVAKEEGLSFFAITAGFLTAMAVKPNGGSVTYPYTDVERRYLFDAGSYVTNDAVCVSFSRAAFVPETAPLYMYARPVGSTNDVDWTEVLSTSFAAFPVPQWVTFPGAQTNDFVLFTTWTPGPAAHTNGVAVVYWRAASTNKAALIRTGLYLDGERVAPNPAITNGWPVVIDLEKTEAE